ncbi:aldehyde dehydrogenase family protein [Labrys monachus]|uniref:aldehyde dehydrogenase family protein n=1 Tax=Labrys monachus TaxID=217067 RepID=UPI0027D7F487|nr:aldehyde dehydrogenase family protein [Labrys monachus]
MNRTRLAETLAGVPKAHELFIGGRFVPAGSGRTIERTSPAHGVTVSTYAEAGAADLDAALEAARAAFDRGPWPSMTGAERSRLLHKVADLVEARLEVFATLDTLESGKPISQARGEMAGAVDIWRYAAGLARDLHGESYSTLGASKLGLVVREPIGVVSIITPWNFPFLIVSQKLPFALAAGCTAVVKPSEMTSGSTLLLGSVLAEAGLPEGVVNILSGYGAEVGAPMTTDPRVDMVSFTGSTRVGKAAMAAAAATLKKMSMELGGKNPQIVFPDADLDAALDAAVFGAYFNAGECCNAGSRLLVHRDIAGQFEAAFVERSKKVVIGDPLDPQTLVGALISPQHLALVEGHVAHARTDGADIALGGSRLDSEAGQFMAATVVAGALPSMAIARDEVFGPVATIMRFSSADEAVAIANGVDYGLSASVWSRDFDTAVGTAKRIRAGTVWTNTFMDGAAELPFGGFRQSGVGRELGRHAAADYTEEKTLHLHCGPRTAWWLPR